MEQPGTHLKNRQPIKFASNVQDQRCADSEVIEALKRCVGNSQQFMHPIIEVAANPPTTQAAGFRFQIEHLAQAHFQQGGQGIHTQQQSEFITGKRH